jgi:hypothetical protein
MYKYRDTIVDENNIFGTFLSLIYNNEEEYSKYPLYKRIETVNI